MVILENLFYMVHGQRVTHIILNIANYVYFHNSWKNNTFLISRKNSFASGLRLTNTLQKYVVSFERKLRLSPGQLPLSPPYLSRRDNFVCT